MGTRNTGDPLSDRILKIAIHMIRINAQSAFICTKEVAGHYYMNHHHLACFETTSMDSKVRIVPRSAAGVAEDMGLLVVREGIREEDMPAAGMCTGQHLEVEDTHAEAIHKD